jgi:phosphoribosylglycinamide formyltransferase-1
MKNIVIFASGNGSNAQRIAEYFADKREVSIKRIYSNKTDAFVLTRARNLNIPGRAFTRQEFYESGTILRELENDKPDLIVLAGFLWKVPDPIIARFPNRIINIHPALLPKYGGKGMYGARVHEAVIQNEDKTSGITIHFVNERYDEGAIIFQASCPVSKDDTPDTLAVRVHQLEYAHFPEQIEKLLFS